ncbi:hypothetical protein [Streptomyces sp. NPDC005046]
MRTSGTSWNLPKNTISTPHPGALATTLRTDQDQRKRSHYMIDWRETPTTEERLLAHDAQELRDLYAGKTAGQ